MAIIPGTASGSTRQSTLDRRLSMALRRSRITPARLSLLRRIKLAVSCADRLRHYPNRTTSPFRCSAGRHKAANPGATACGVGNVVRSSPGNAFDRMRVATGPGSNRLTRSVRGRDFLRPGQHQVLHPRLRRPHRPPIRPRLPRSAFGHEHRAARRRLAQQRIAGADQPPARGQVHRRRRRPSHPAGYATPASAARARRRCGPGCPAGRSAGTGSGRWRRSARPPAGPAAGSSPRRRRRGSRRRFPPARPGCGR